uniref:Wsv133 n=1 Tax=White spot syndrome virus TaxID=92652 RepID=A0A2U9GEM3_WSSV|nr:wsv133 [Shrimp white spot syndrome virus]
MDVEFGFFHGLLSKALLPDEKHQPVIRRLCADDSRNKGEDGCCSFCGRRGTGESNTACLEQLIDVCSFIGTVSSIGTIINSNLSTSCSRLQKQSDSYAALSHSSFLDVVYPSLKKTTEDVLPHSLRAIWNKQLPKLYEKTLQPIEEEDIGYKDYVVSIEDDDNVDDGDQQEQMIIDEESYKTIGEKSTIELIGMYNNNKFGNEFIRIPLRETALHAQSLRYDTEAKFVNHKDSIPLFYENSTCTCKERLIDFSERQLQQLKQDGMDKPTDK